MPNRVMKGVAWSTIGVVVRNVVAFLQIVILTRILPREDFGVIAIATLFVHFTQLFLDMGISVGIMHFRDISKRVYSSLFWLNVLTGVLLTAVLFGVTPLLTAKYDSPDLTHVLRLLCFTLLLNALGSQQRVVCQKLLRFKLMAIVEIAGAVVTFGVAVSTAMAGCGVYSLAYSSLAGAAVINLTFLIVGVVGDSRVGWHFNLRETFPFLKIGVYNMGGSLLDFLARELDIFIVSNTLGLDFLGVYNIAKRIPATIFSFVQPVLQKVAVPLLAEINNDVAAMRSKSGLMERAVSMGIVPIYAVIAALAPMVIYYVFGGQYVDGAPVLMAFCVVYAIAAVTSTISMAQVPLGRTDIGLYWTVFRIASVAVVYFVCAQFGVEVFLCGVAGLALVHLVVMWWMQGRPLLKMPLKEYVGNMIVPAGVSLLLAVGILVLNIAPSNLLFGIGAGVVFVVVYGAMMLLWQRSEVVGILQTLGMSPQVIAKIEALPMGKRNVKK